MSRRLNGVQRRFTITDGAHLSLAEARTAAIKLRADLVAQRDPTAERREARKTARLARTGIGRSWTIATLVDEYGERVAKPAGQRSWLERRAQVLHEFRDYAGLPIEEITDAHLWRVLDAATARGAKVGGWHSLRYLCTVLGWAATRKLIARDPTTDLPLKDIRKRMKERPRERVLSYEELGRLWRAFEAEPGSVYSAVFQVATLTAQRLGEVAGMRWADLDLARREWRQPTNKSDRPHVVPLSEAALAIVEARPRRKDTDLVFTSGTGGRLDRRTGNWYRATARYSKQTGVVDWWPHDLRRTAATILAEMRVATVVIEQLLNHAEGAGKGSAVAAIYNRHSYGMEKRQAVEKLAERVLAVAARDTGKVVELAAKVE